MSDGEDSLGNDARAASSPGTACLRAYAQDVAIVSTLAQNLRTNLREKQESHAHFGRGINQSALTCPEVTQPALAELSLEARQADPALLSVLYDFPAGNGGSHRADSGVLFPITTDTRSKSWGKAGNRRKKTENGGWKCQ